MALTFWYGGHLVADRDINAMQLWIIFLAVVAGGEAAGEFFANSNSQKLSLCLRGLLIWTRHLSRTERMQ